MKKDVILKSNLKHLRLPTMFREHGILAFLKTYWEFICTGYNSW